MSVPDNTMTSNAYSWMSQKQTSNGTATFRVPQTNGVALHPDEQPVPIDDLADMSRSPKGSLSDDDPWMVFAQKNFTDGQPAFFARKDIRRPLLAATSERESAHTQSVWKVILRFMGDQVDYRSDIETSNQPDQGSVMSRLYATLGISQSERDLRRRENENNHITRHAADNDTGYEENLNEAMKSMFEGKKRGGTLRRLKATLTRRLFTPKQKSVFDLLPLEETLMTPLDQLHFIIGLGILKPELRDEIYCQICKQLVKNPFKTSQSRGWLLLALCAGCFSPSAEVYPVIQQYVENGAPYYASLCRKLLQRTKDNGQRFQPPSLLEFESGLQKKFLEIPVTFMDATQQTVLVDSATTARELCHRLSRGVGLKDTYGFSVYITMNEKVASLGNGNDHIFDAISQCEQIYREKQGKQSLAPWRLFFRKEVFAPWETTRDPIATGLIYSQITRGIMLGEYVCKKDAELAILCAQQYFIDYGPHMTSQSLAEVLPSYIPPERRAEADSMRSWKKLVSKAFNKLFTAERDDVMDDTVKADVVRYAKVQWPLHFSRFYEVKKMEGPQDWPSDRITLAVNWVGLYLVSEGKTIYRMQYAEISEFLQSEGDPPNTLTLRKVNGSVFKFSATDADDIRHITEFMLDGLKQRSPYAVATQQSSAALTDLVYIVGDLLEMKNKDAQGNKGTKRRMAVNTRTKASGEVLLDHVYIIPIVTKPSPEILRIYQANTREVL